MALMRPSICASHSLRALSLAKRCADVGMKSLFPSSAKSSRHSPSASFEMVLRAVNAPDLSRLSIASL